MKNILTTPFWIVVSIVIGLSTLVLSSNCLYQMTVDQPRVITIRQVNKTDSTQINIILKNNIQIDTSGIILFSKNSNKIDSILYGSSFQYISADKTLRERLFSINSKAFINLNPAVFRWIIFHSVSLSLSLASLIFLLNLVYKLFKEYKPFYTFISYISLLVGLLSTIGFIFYVSRGQSIILSGQELMEYFKLIFKYPNIAIQSITLPMFSVALVPIIGILLINLGTYFSFEKKVESKTSQELEEKYKDLKGNLNLFAFYLGLLVSCAVIGTGLQRDMIISHIGKANEILYPKELLYAYGIAFSMILALFFAPSYAYLRYVARDYSNKNDDLGKWWEIGKETIDNIKLVLAIALPLISSIVQPFIKDIL